MDIILMRNPPIHGDPADRSTGLRLSWDDWSELFNEALDVSEREPYAEGEPYFDFNERQRSLFSAEVNGMGYPLLGRFFDIYEDVAYMPSEVSDLLNECESISGNRQENDIPSAITKLTEACNAALKDGLGILLSSD